ncbi:MAG: dihydroorotate dehydrogenase [Candidatus Hodarchaeota archaeon]
MIPISIGDIALQYPWMVASGILGTTAALINRLGHCKVGGIVTKSVGTTPRAGFSNPTVIGLPGPLEGSFLNAVGLSNPGATGFIKELTDLESPEVPIIASVFGGDALEISQVATTLDNAMISGFEVNLSCPHGGKYGMALGTLPETVYQVIAALKESTRKPVWAKLTPNVTDIVSIGKAAEEAGADAIVAINTLQAAIVDIWTRKLVLSHGIGGLSGPCIRPIALRCVKQLYENLEIPIIGVGGVSTWENVVEFLLVGASAVQIGSALHRCQPEIVFAEIAQGFENYLKNEGISNPKELVGLAIGC